MKLQNKDSVMNLGDTSFRRKNLLDDYKVMLQGITEQLEEWDTKNSSQMTFYQYVAKSGLINDTFYSDYYTFISNKFKESIFEKYKNKNGVKDYESLIKYFVLEQKKRGRTYTNALVKMGIDYKLNPGDGAFYGPKIDFKMKDSIGRIWQCGTIQLDFNLPLRFHMSYIGPDGEKHQPVMIHRAMYGSIERFMGILIEHYAGAFPIWLAPVQVSILTISEEQAEYASDLFKKLQDIGIRTELDTRDEKIGYKIREANAEQKIPVQLIIGKNEVANNEVNIRRFGSQESTTMKVDDFLKLIEEESKIVF